MNVGAALMVGASLAFTLMVACVKAARAEMAAVEIIVWRAAISVPIVYLLGRRGGLRIGRRGLFLFRAILGFTAMICAFTAAHGLSLADLSFVWRLQPVFIAVMAPLALGAGERVGPAVLVALGCCLAGCAVLLAPSLGADTASYAVLALVGALLSGSAHVCVRALGASEPPGALVFWFQVFAAIGAMLVCTVQRGTPVPMPSTGILPYLVGTGVFAAAGQTAMTHAYHRERATVVSTAGYMGPVFGVLLDWLLFGIVVTGSTLVGGAIIVASSVWLVLRTPARPVDPSVP